MTQTKPVGKEQAVAEVSVVIPTYRRDDLLERCLCGVLGQDYPADRLEVIVVDDGRSASTHAVIDAVRTEHPGTRVVLLKGTQSGPAGARNIGWRAATGNIVAFIDDDAYPANQNWLASGLAGFEDASVLGVSGKVVVSAPNVPTDFQRNVKNLERGEFLTCNAFYRRDALEAVGGFDERFRVPFREDSDLQFRLEAAGAKLLKTSEAVVIHPAPPGPFGVSAKLQRYSMFNALIYKKHPDRYPRDIQNAPPLNYYAMVGLLMGAAGAALRGRWLQAAALLGGWAFLEGRFFYTRVRGTSRTPRHLADMAVTSLIIPPLSIYWRLRGALRFRVLFL